MEVNVAKTFLASTQQLTAAERGRVLDFLAKFMNNPAHPGISLERVKNTGDSDVWSARITQNLRAIIHRAGERNTLLYAGQHDDAYHWAERRRLEHHAKTGCLQIVETTEAADEALKSQEPIGSRDQSPGVFAEFPDDYLLSLGLPEDWLPTIRRVCFEDQVLTVAQRLPEEVGERLLALASGDFVTPPAPASPDEPLSEHPDNLRRFWVVRDAGELVDVLNRPWADWVKFLHPSQRQLVIGNFRGPVKITGAAGTGKTVVALHRARHLAEQGQRVFLTTFVSTLCRNLQKSLEWLCPKETLSRITVETVHHRALHLAKELQPELRPLESKELRELIEALKPKDIDLSTEFLIAEWSSVIEPLGITSWEEYEAAPRTARKRRLSAGEREAGWRVFRSLREEMEKRSAYSWERICQMARLGLETGHLEDPFDAVIVDELQDLAPAALRFLAQLAAPNPESFFLVGDAGQRIYPGGFSLRKLGVDVRGRSHVLRINYRTTEQIRRFADRLLPNSVDDLDSEVYRRRSFCLLHGPAPGMAGFETPDEEDQFLAKEIRSRLNEGLSPSEIAVFARAGNRLESLRNCLETQGVASHLLSRDDTEPPADAVQTGTMHRAKGLEFKVVFAIDCSKGILPHEKVLGQAGFPETDQEAIDRERRLLYVTLTRARDESFITWSGERSEFLDGLDG